MLQKTTENDRKEFARCENRIRAISEARTWNPAVAADMEKIRNWCGMTPTLTGNLIDDVFPLAEPYQPLNSNPRVFKSDRWKAHLETLATEAAECFETLVRLRTVNERVAREAEQLRSFWLPK